MPNPFLIEEFEHAGLRVELLQEEHQEPFNPREAQDNVGTMVFWERDYRLGDEQRREEPDWECPVCEGTGEVAIEEPQPSDQPGVTDCTSCEGAGSISFSRWLAHRNAQGDVAFALQFQDYGSSGARLYVHGDPDDGRAGGYIIAEKAKIEHEWDGDTVKAREYLEGEVKEYDQYIQGEVYWWRVVGPDGATLESVGGYIGGFDDYVRDEAKSGAESAAQVIAHEREQAEYWATRDVITVG